MSNIKFFCLITHIWLLGFAITKEIPLVIMALIYAVFTGYCFIKDKAYFYDQRTH